MPILFDAPVRRVPQEEFHDIDYRVMGLVFQMHNELGNLCSEAIYRNELCYRCEEVGFEARQELSIHVQYLDFEKRYSADLLVNNAAVYELKAVDVLAPAHRTQALNYLFLTGLAHGKLINMRPRSVVSEFMSTRATAEARRDTRIDDGHWLDGDADSRRLQELMLELLAEWGAFLEIQLFYDAIVHFLGGAERVIQLIDIVDNDRLIGRQPMYILNPAIAFRITALTKSQSCFEAHLRRFLKHTILERIQWINLNHLTIEFRTIER